MQMLTANYYSTEYTQLNNKRIKISDNFLIRIKNRREILVLWA